VSVPLLDPKPDRTRIKFCGMTRAEDVALAAELGVDAIGIVLVPKSPRYVAPSAAAQLRASTKLATVALFQNADALFAHRAIEQVRPDLLQFHGDEDEAFCAAFGIPYVKAVSMHAPQDLPKLSDAFASAAGLLLDSHPAGGLGGTGHAFDWSAVAPIDKPIVLAGGLTADNVASGIARVRPAAVDVSSGIEQKPGVKDSAKMRDFVEAVRRADRDAHRS
jgi:phosphoribosylanthranilate isomerase